MSQLVTIFGCNSLNPPDFMITLNSVHSLERLRKNDFEKNLFIIYKLMNNTIQ